MYTIRVVKHRVAIVSAETIADLLHPLQTPFHLSEGHMSENCSVTPLFLPVFGPFGPYLVQYPSIG